MANEFIARKGLIVSGNVVVTGNVTASNFAGIITSSSFASTASAATSITFVPQSASYALSASYAPGVSSGGNTTLVADNYLFIANGSTTQYQVSKSYNDTALIVTVGGLTYISPDDYSVSASTITFVEAPASASNIAIKALVNVTDNATGSFSGSFTGDGSGLYNIAAPLAIETYTFDSDGFTSSFSLGKIYPDNAVIVSVDGLTYINPTDYTLSGTNLVFVDTPTSGSTILARVFLNVTNNVTGVFTGSFIGTLTGTGSWAQNAISSSFATTASYVTSPSFDGYINFANGLVVTGSTILSGSGLALQVSGSASIRDDFLVNGNSFYVNAATGRVGVGTLLPVNTLQVAGNVSASSYTSSLNNQVGYFGTSSWAQSSSVAISSSFATTTSFASTAPYGGLTGTPTGILSSSTQFNALTSTSASFAITASYALTSAGGGGALSGGTTNYIPLWTSATAQSSSVMFQSSTNIGIGTTSPGSKLDINQSAGNTLALNLFGSTTTGESFGQRIYAGTNSSDYALNIRDRGDTLTYLYVRGDGNVGIGTTTPTLGALHVVGKIYSTTEAQINSAVIAERDGYAFFGSNSAVRPIAITRDANPLNNPDIIITTAGNVGIGTSTPSTGAKLHIQGNVSASSFTGSIASASFATTASYALTSAGGGGLSGGTTNYIPLWTSATAQGSSLMYQISNNIGIGTITPPSKLTVVGDISSSGNMSLNAGSFIGFTPEFSLGGTTPRSYIRAAGSNNFDLFVQAHQNIRFGTNLLNAGENTQIIITPDGDLGVGTQTVNAKLHVSASGTKNDLLIGSTTVPKLFVSGSGNVGIGTTTPTARLEVNGSFVAQTKSFKIQHQVHRDKSLVYGVLEGPEHAVYVRGRLKNNNTIKLPDEWDWLVDADSITVQLTPVGKHQKVFVKEIINGVIFIDTDDIFSSNIDCYYLVHGTRKDVDKLETVV